MRKMNSTNFGKRLHKLSQEELVDLILKSCKASPLVYEFIISHLNKEANVVKMDLIKKWMEIPENFREKLLNNCFCSKCHKVVGMKDFTLKEDKFGLVLVGKCKECGFDVVRCLDE
ncbi:MAG: hypothetical protein ACYC21_13585 [Eubacteriales bacterium]